MKASLHKIFSGFLIGVYISTIALPGAVRAISVNSSSEQFPAAKHEPRRGTNPETGKTSFIGAGDPIFVPSVSDVKGLPPQERGLGMANAYGKEFGLKNPSQELKLLKSQKDHHKNDVVHYQQVYKDVPVIAGEMIVNMNTNGELLSISGEVSSDLNLNTKPAIKSQEARETALTEIANIHNIDETQLTASDPELSIFDESLLTASTRPVELVWRMEVTAKEATQPIREMVLVNAQTGNVSWHINQVDTNTHANPERSQSVLENQQAAPLTAASPIQYVDLVVDEARGKLYGADKTGNKIDVIDMNDLSIMSSYTLAVGALPTGIDLSPNGNELAVAQSGFDRVKFINLIDGTISDMPSALSGLNTKAFDVLYGRPGILYTLSTNGLHTINSITHAEDASQFVGDVSDEKFGTMTSNKNTLFYVTGTCCSGYNSLHKLDVSAGLTKPIELGYTYLYNSGYKRNIRLSLADDNTLLTSFGTIYNISDLTPKAKNGQVLSPVISLPWRDFYATVYENTSGTDTLQFFDKESSYKVSMLNTISGTPGAMAVTSNGNTLFVSSTGGMTKFDIGSTPPGTPINLPQSLKQYRDFAFDMLRGVIYGTDASGRIDLIEQSTGYVFDSYLLPNGANPIGIDLSPESNELAIALNGLEKILFINPETGEKIAESTPQLSKDIYYTNLPYDVIYGREGRLYSDGNPGSGGTDYIHVFDTRTHTWRAKSTYSIRTGAELAITADKNYLYANETFSPNNVHVFDIQTDTITKLYQGPHGPVYAYRFAITPDGKKVFTTYGGQVWSGNMQERLGSLEVGALETGPGIEYIPGQDAVVMVAYDTNGSFLSFISSVNYRLLTTYHPIYDGDILEMEISPDGSKLIVNFSIGAILVLDISTILPVPPTPPPTPALSTIQYADLVVDEARGKLYGADKAGSKIDVINMSDMFVTGSYLLPYGAAPTSIDLSPDGNELAVAQSALSRVAFINLNDGTISENPAPLSGSVAVDPVNPYDVVYGRPGILYTLSNTGIHTINTSATPHAEDANQYVLTSSDEKFGAITTDKNTLFYVTGTCCSGYNTLRKFNVSAGLTKPVELAYTYLPGSSFQRNIRLSLADDSTLLTSWGSIYDASTLTLKAKNTQYNLPVVALPGRNFYVVAYEDAKNPDALYFFDEQSSHKLSYLSTGKMGVPGAMTATGDGNTLFVSSTGGMSKFDIGATLPGTPLNLPQSLKQYRDFAFDMPRGVIYGTDASGRIDVIDQSTGNSLNSYLLPNGANPIGIDLSPDGSELAVAMNGLESILFVDPETGVEIARVKPLNNSDTNLPYDVLYGRAGRLYSDANPSSGGIDYIHVIDTVTHSWVTRSPYPNTLRTGAEFSITADKNYLYANETFSPNNIYVFDIQTDTIAKLYQGPHGPVAASKFTIVPDGSKVFTSNGQVWSGIMQTQLGTLQGGPGNLIDFVSGQDALALAVGNAIKFISTVDYQLLSTYNTSYTGNALEMEVAPDGSRLIANYSGGNIFILDLTTFPPPTPVPTITPTFTPSRTPTITRTPTIVLSPTSSKTPGPGPSPTPRPSSTAGPSPTSVPPGSTGSRRTYSAAGVYTYPGTFLCNETQAVCTDGADLDADAAHQYGAETFVFYHTHHGRNSFDNQGAILISTVNYGVNYRNAFWTGSQMVYGDAMAVDDVVGHEITHAVTQYTSGLIYSYQSGAINESFSDVWGEFIDQSNNSGNDSLSVKWLMGEDTPLSAIRSMSNPPAFGHPDKMSSPYYYNGSGDNGGVHFNSGVNNKAAYLMVEGGSFNSRNIIGIGLNKTAAVYYEAQVRHLTMGANYNDLYYALLQACQNLIGGVDGITQSDCLQVQLAAEAVEMILTLPPTPTPTLTFTSTLTPTNTFTPTATPPYSYNPLYLSLSGNQTIGGVASADEDILRFDGTTWSLFFDGSDVGVGSSDLFGFSIVDADTILMAFSSAVTVNGISALPQDILRFEATSLGTNTAGTFYMYLNGIDVGLDVSAEKLDSVSLLSDGRVLISTTGNPAVAGVTGGKDEDVLAFTPTTLGNATSGSWAMYFDGSDVGLADVSGEDVDALDVAGDRIYLSTADNFTVNGASGADEDVFVCNATSLGDVTACNYSSTLYFDGSTWNLSANDVDAFNLPLSGSTPTTTPTNTPTFVPATPTRTSTPLQTFAPSHTPTRTPTIISTITISPTVTSTPMNVSATPTFTFTPSPIWTATSTQTATSTLSAPDLIFADGFESGNLSAWTSSAIDAGDLSVSASAALNGNQGVQAVIDDANTIYVTDDNPNAESRYRARFYFDSNSIPMASGDTHYIFKGFAGTSTEVLRLEFRQFAGGYQVRVALLSDGNTWISNIWFNITDAPHAFELDWRAATGASANNGGLAFWIDGVLQLDLTGIDNDTWRIDRVRLGALSGIDAGTSGIYYFDAFESRRQNYIGP